MDISEFVQQTLGGIIDGVNKSREKHGEYVNPVVEQASGSRAEIFAPEAGRGLEIVQHVEFDIAVTTESSKGGEGKISVLGISAGGDLATKNTVANRIRFSIPITLPRGTGEING